MAFKPQPSTPTSLARFAPCGAFLCLQHASPAPQSVHPYTEKKNRLAPLGSSAHSASHTPTVQPQEQKRRLAPPSVMRYLQRR